MRIELPLRHLATVNLWRNPDMSLSVTFAEANGVKEELGESGAPVHLCAMNVLRAAVASEAAETILALRAALEPFAAMGRVMETRARVTFGKMPKDSEIVCESSGEAGMGILTMGHFRDAAATLPDAPGWGGMYKPLPIRAAHQGASEP